VTNLIAEQLLDGGRGDLHSKPLLHGGSNLDVSQRSIRCCQDFYDRTTHGAELQLSVARSTIWFNSVPTHLPPITLRETLVQDTCLSV
jgi:hypothetical protein